MSIDSMAIMTIDIHMRSKNLLMHLKFVMNAEPFANTMPPNRIKERFERVNFRLDLSVLDDKTFFIIELSDANHDP